MKAFFKQFDHIHLVLIAIVMLALFAEYSIANTNEKLRGELETVKVQLQWAQGDLDACRGNFTKAQGK